MITSPNGIAKSNVRINIIPFWAKPYNKFKMTSDTVIEASEDINIPPIVIVC